MATLDIKAKTETKPAKTEERKPIQGDKVFWYKQVSDMTGSRPPMVESSMGFITEVLTSEDMRQVMGVNILIFRNKGLIEAKHNVHYSGPENRDGKWGWDPAPPKK